LLRGRNDTQRVSSSEAKKLRRVGGGGGGEPLLFACTAGEIATRLGKWEIFLSTQPGGLGWSTKRAQPRLRGLGDYLHQTHTT